MSANEYVREQCRAIPQENEKLSILSRLLLSFALTRYVGFMHKISYIEVSRTVDRLILMGGDQLDNAIPQLFYHTGAKQV